MSDKSATERLREMLDERGVAHSDHYLSTTWRDGHGILHLAGEPMADGLLVVDMLTPEQAIAATLGNSRANYHGYEQAAIEAWESVKAWNSRAERTCKWELEHSGTLYDKWRCSKCGYLFVEPRCDQGYTDLEPNYCPNCGRRCI